MVNFVGIRSKRNACVIRRCATNDQSMGRNEAIDIGMFRRTRRPSSVGHTEARKHESTDHARTHSVAHSHPRASDRSMRLLSTRGEKIALNGCSDGTKDLLVGSAWSINSLMIDRAIDRSRDAFGTSFHMVVAPSRPLAHRRQRTSFARRIDARHTNVLATDVPTYVSFVRCRPTVGAWIDRRVDVGRTTACVRACDGRTDGTQRKTTDGRDRRAGRVHDPYVSTDRPIDRSIDVYRY